MILLLLLIVCSQVAAQQNGAPFPGGGFGDGFGFDGPPMPNRRPFGMPRGPPPPPFDPAFGPRRPPFDGPRPFGPDFRNGGFFGGRGFGLNPFDRQRGPGPGPGGQPFGLFGPNEGVPPPNFDEQRGPGPGPGPRPGPIPGLLGIPPPNFLQEVGRRLEGWRRSRPIDNAHAFLNLRKFGLGKTSIRDEDWNEHAMLFCAMFPHHFKCRDGALPLQGDLSILMQAIERRQQRREIPRLAIRDWFGGVPAALRQLARQRIVAFGTIDKDVMNMFRSVCTAGKVNCRIQPDDAKEQRKMLRDLLTKVEKERLKVDDETADDNVEIRFDRTLRIKRALLEKANLTAEVDPIDDGVFEQDILLTETQSNMLLNHLGKAGTTGDENLSPDEADEIPQPGKDGAGPSNSTNSAPKSSNSRQRQQKRRNRRSGVFVEENFAEKWDLTAPIPYTFDDSIASWDRTDIEDGLAAIARASCIKFKYFAQPPSSHHINYVKINSPTFCGLSYVGRVSPANTVYLSFQCGKNVGVVVHETLHALGVIHQHLRFDRDQFIKVEWSNVNPQKYDQFATADQSMYTSYGVKYSYDSIMHYNAYTNAIDSKKPTMVPLLNSSTNLRLLGQRDKLSDTDVSLINKMYCKPASCVDTNIYCGHWALSGVCTLKGNSQWMAQNCKKSCNIC